jgi:CO/xanthine dehydrogenase FAD-binding subunit
MSTKFASAIMALSLLLGSASFARPAGADPFRPPSASRPSFDATALTIGALARLDRMVRAEERNRWIAALSRSKIGREATRAFASPRASSPSSSGGSCGAIPAWISQRESRCTYTARNPSGAGGAYQLMPSTADAMAARIGHPELIGQNAASWPPALQDAAAAALWNGGAGACNWTPPTYCG